MNSRTVNAMERRLGVDLNGDGYIGGEGYLAQLERATGRDINGDGLIGRRPDVVPAVYGYHSMLNGQSYATNNFVAPHTMAGYSPYSTNPYNYHRHF
ncbi:unnamed protein product [Adineta steineri]|uniref:EF-hand domain-containing protein n=1 Tax=Adineta steineri TaxID=433720 RepID=A0A819LFN8_9BILA|nr:unnamed protein product [Adineta steineri]CAF4359154.1 unnamed protein product [Adineta steineri]